MSEKRITFSTATPNDQGFIIPNEVINFERYKKHPVILAQHNWNAPPIGKMTEIKQEKDGSWTGLPIFHRGSPDSILYADLWESGFLEACSIGGFKELKMDKFGKPETNTEGVAICSLFDLYEISMVTIPSNPDAIARLNALRPFEMDAIKLPEIENQIIFLSSVMDSKNEAQFLLNEIRQLVKENTPKEKTNLTPMAEETTAAKTKLKAEAPKTNELPEVIKKAIDKKSSTGNLFSAIANFLKGSVPDDEYDKPEKNFVEDEPGEDKWKSTMPKLAASAKALQSALSELKAAKEKAEKEEATEEEKKEYEKAKEKAKECAEKMESDMEEMAAKEDEEDEESDEVEKDDEEKDRIKAKKAKEKAEKEKAEKEKAKEKSEHSAGRDGVYMPTKRTLSTGNAPRLKTPEQLMAEHAQLAAAPSYINRAKVGAQIGGKTLTQLLADPDGKKIYERYSAKNPQTTTLDDYRVVLHAMLNDHRYAAVHKQMRLMKNVTEAQLGSYQQNPKIRGGQSIFDVANELDRGQVEFMARDNTMRQITTLTSTDNFLASPSLFAIEFLDLAIFKLFPATAWKKDIPLFAAQATGENTGIVWSNITANPAIYIGIQPTPADYTYMDAAVSMSLTPYWLQPILWTPLLMHQIREDQMGTGWAQALALLGSVIDDQLIYTLASFVPRSSYVYTTGISPYNQPPAAPYTFTIASSSSPNAFIFSPSFTGTLDQPTLNDVISIEQIYNKQNFELDNERPVLVMDPTTDAFLAKSQQTQSLLTRWIDGNDKEQVAFRHTEFSTRSRVAIFNPQTDQVLNPTSVIPSTATSANLGFLPSQVGMGLGMFDVFFVQDPAAYGYRMSCDIRVGISPLRVDNSGIALYPYGPQIIS